MKAGPCREVFEVWQECVDGVLDSAAPASSASEAGATGHQQAASVTAADTRKEAATACAGVTGPLFECMQQHRDYYGSAMGAPPPSQQAPGAGAGETAAGEMSAAAAAPS